jgi:citrate lyase subunit beta/citryl-CoA lyase
VHKALESAADAVVLDLEDSIDQSARAIAHEILLAASDAIGRRPTHLRVGMIDGAYRPEDVELAGRLMIEAVRLPKVESAAAVTSVGSTLGSIGANTAIHLTVESAAGLAHLGPLAEASDRVSRIVFGERDFLADLGVGEPGPLTDHARASIAVTSRALRLAAPIDGAFIDLTDDEGLRNSCRRARRLGFGGKSALHPRQLETIHEVFSPNQEEIEQAIAIVEAYDAARASGEVTTVVEGRFVDEAVARRARSVIESGEVEP